jgi:teichuronic acid biosynthesis glycosyltransferase TuaG
MNIINTKVSIVVPCYNSQDYILQTVESLLAQTHQNIEVLLYDDCSTDHTLSILQNYSKLVCDERLYIIQGGENRGVAFARNSCLAKATGNVIAFCDSDDTWRYDKLELQLKYMKNEGGHACHSFYFRCDQDLNIRSLVTSPQLVTKKDMSHRNYIGNLTGIYNASFLNKVYFSEDMGHEDFQMWLQILSKTNSVCVEEPLAYYRVRGDSLSSNKFMAAIWHARILINNFGLIDTIVGLTSYITFHMKNIIKGH